MVYFTDSANNKKFHTLTVDELATSNSAYAMRTNLSESDKLEVKNTCLVRTIFYSLISFRNQRLKNN